MVEDFIRKSSDKNFFLRCLDHLPLSLAIIRSLECKQFDMFDYERPILDIGCGDGLFSKFLFDERTDIGVDITFRFIKLAQKRGSFRMGCQSDATFLPFKNDSFNSVISNCVVEHIVGIDRLFNEIKRILKPGGIFVFTTHTHQYNDFLFYNNLLYKLKLDFLGRGYETLINALFKHKNCLHPDIWVAKLEDAGLFVEHISYYYGPTAQRVFDLFLPFSFPRFLLWKVTGRWFLLGRNLLSRVQYLLLKRIYDEKPPMSSALVIKAIRR